MLILHSEVGKENKPELLYFSYSIKEMNTETINTIQAALNNGPSSSTQGKNNIDSINTILATLSKSYPTNRFSELLTVLGCKVKKQKIFGVGNVNIVYRDKNGYSVKILENGISFDQSFPNKLIALAVREFIYMTIGDFDSLLFTYKNLPLPCITPTMILLSDDQ